VTPELKFEKAVQHSIVYGQFVAKEATSGASDAFSVMSAATARLYRFKALKDGKDPTSEEVVQEFAEMMRAQLAEQCGAVDAPW
jgi:hypothetical protein